MKPVAWLVLLCSASVLHASEAQELFHRAVRSTCPVEQVELYTEALNKDPGLEMGHHNLGAAYYRLGEYGKAAHVLEMALEANPRYPNTHYLLSCCYSRLGKVDQALGHLRKALRYGWHEADMVASDADLDALRGADFPRAQASSRRKSRGASRPGGRKRSRRRGAAAAAKSGQPDDQPAAASTPPVAGPPDAPSPPPQASGDANKGSAKK